MSARRNHQHPWWDLGGFYSAQPVWARKLYWFVTIPLFLVWGWLIVSGSIETHGGLAFVVFGILFVLAAVHNFFFAKRIFGGRL